MADQNAELYVRFVRERHGRIVNELGGLISCLTGEDKAKKKTQANELHRALLDLKAATPEKGAPQWVSSTEWLLDNYLKERVDSSRLINGLIESKAEIEGYKWGAESSNLEAFDFDRIFEHYKSQSRLDELFEEVVRILETIRESEAIDSISMANSLGKVIATIKNNKGGSYFSLHSAWAFLGCFMKNYMWGELEKIPALGSAVSALRKAIEETGSEFRLLQSNVEREMRAAVESEIKGLQGKSSFGFLTYNSDGVGLDQSGEKKVFAQA